MCTPASQDALPPKRQKTPSLETLQPRFDKSSHQFYVDLLLDALDDPGNRNISLSGQYGTGKSSILAGLKDELAGRRPDLKVIQLTLSTLNSETARKEAAAQDAAMQADAAASGDTAHVVTRALEKEIVKQLLYRAAPRRMPGSRFRRTQAVGGFETFKWVLAVAAVVGLLGVGLITQILWLTLASAAAMASALTVWVVRRGGSGLSLKQVGAAGASLHLDDSRAYFDDYLDDIIYYFEVSKVRVVVFEDIDRFDNLSIFESLRELNILLNETEQLQQPQPIRFIYATRDSIFKYAAPSDKGSTGEHRVGGPESVASSRTKFFDLVVPVIPFATRRTSRDHLTQTSGADVDPYLIDLVAREITDMRLIRNIGNEFRVFRLRVLREDVEVLNPTGLFAMIVYKNLYPAQFEKISTGTSELDAAHRAFRQIVNSTARKLELQPKPTSLHPELAEATRRLKELTILANVAHLQIAGGQSFPPEVWGTYEFWQAVAEAGPEAAYNLQTSPGRSPQLVRGGPFNLFSEPLTVERVNELKEHTTEEYTQMIKAEHASIVGASMRNLINTDVELVDSAGEPVDFTDVITNMVGKDTLVSEMIKNGYIDQNFALYVSERTDLSVSPSALNFVLTAVNPNRPDPRYLFNDADSDIPGVLREAGEAFLTDRRALNVQIVDFLITHGRSEVEALAALIGEGTEIDRSFLDAFIADGRHRNELIRRVAGSWAEIFTYLIQEAQEPNTDLVDAAVGGASASVPYATSPAVKEWLDSHGADLTSLASNESAPPPETVTTVLGHLQVPVTDMQEYSPALQTELIRRHQYAITRQNLTIKIISADHVPSLDELATDDLHQEVLAHLLDDLGAYLLLCEADSQDIVSKPDSYQSVLVQIGNVSELASQLEPERLGALINRAPEAAQIDDLGDLPESLWSAIARTARTVASVGNLMRYLESGRDLDDWSKVLGNLDEIEVAPDDTEKAKTKVAVGVLNTKTVPAEQRIALVQTLHMEAKINPAELADDSIELVPALVETEVVDDSLVTFQRTRNKPEVSRAYIEKSKQMSTYLPQIADLSANELTAIARCGRTETLDVLLHNPALMTDLSDSTAQQIAKAAATRPGTEVPYETLAVLAAQCGDDCQPFVELFATHASRLTSQQVRTLLDAMPDPYPQLGKKETELPTWNGPLLDCLEQHAITTRKRKKYRADLFIAPPPNM